MTGNVPPQFRELTGIYEPSAVQQLPDGRFIVVEDERERPFCLLTLAPGDTVVTVPLESGWDEILGKLNDLEGIAVDRSGWIYAITSHSRNDEGDEKKSREKLVRFRIEGNRLSDPFVVTGLKQALAATHPALAAAVSVLDVKAVGGLNIEALDVDPDGQRLRIGLRGPLLDGRAVIATVENAAAIFGAGELPRIARPLDTVDLGGHGIRGLSYAPILNGYLIVSGPVAREDVQFDLWFWSGRHDESPRRVVVPGLPGFERAEGIGTAIIDGRQQFVVVSDDGNRAEGRCAHYLLLDAEPVMRAISPP